ncbi:tRNA (adenosine(37)-N6)-threonylcarbamoyltransferase complex ATPase subunit type 1 TsaE [Patescibacteria group bacterium]
MELKKKTITNSPSETKKLGKILAKKILQKSQKTKNATVIGLKGDLGGGKTTFLQGFAKGLGLKENIVSPTFIILKRFPVKKRNFYHIDCYRIEKQKEILDLGFRKIIQSNKNIIVIEWADRIKNIMPKGAFWISFDFLSKNKREIRRPSKV